MSNIESEESRAPLGSLCHSTTGSCRAAPTCNMARAYDPHMDVAAFVLPGVLLHR